MDKTTEIVSSLTLELRRGTIVLSVLSQLDTPKYGYSLVQSLEEKNIIVDTSTLYPLLRRLEKQELLISEWETDGAKPRKYYRRTRLGDQVFQDLSKQWIDMIASMDQLLRGEKDYE